MLSERIKGKGLKIVYPEATDARILGAVSRHNRAGLLEPILIGNPEEVKKRAAQEGFGIDGVKIYDPENYDEFDAMVDSFVERRNGKATEEEAREILKDPNYFATMLVYMDIADGMVSGAVGTTAETIRPALQIIKTDEYSNLVSGAMVMLGQNGEKFIFSDMAVTITPTSEQLAEIANTSARTAESFDINPKVALLSFSTKGSASSPDQERVAEGARIAKRKFPGLDVDGELQFDAAISPVVANRKAPDSVVAGQANVFIFPDVQSGNISYKVAERLGGYQALGPILQGLAKPVNDLSRGCTEDDAYKLGIITAATAVSFNRNK